MILNRTQLRALILEEISRASFIREGEEEGGEESTDAAADDLFGGEDEGGDDAADEGGDETADEEDTDAGGDEGSEESGDEEGGEEEEDAADEDKEEDKEEDEEEEALGPVGDEIDMALKDVMADFEKRALDSAAAKAKIEPSVGPKKEGRMSLVKLLFEADEVPIDMGTFASDVARLINNYDTLIDMEGAIYTKAVDFIDKKYGKDYAEQLRNTLSQEHNIEIDVKQDPEKAEQPIYAVGAFSGAGGA